MKSVKFEGEYQVRADEVAPDKSMKVPSLIKLMQEGSMQNSLEHQFSVWDMEAENISWVLVRKKVSIHALPVLSQKIKVVTYPIMTQNILASRDFKIYDDTGELIASASSIWTLINLETRKLQRIPERFTHLVTPPEESILEPPSSKINKPIEVHFEKNFTPAYYDADWNDHVNNVYFIKSIIESTPIEIIKTRRIKELTYHIRAESLIGDELTVEGQASENQYLYVMKRRSDEKAVAYAEILWE